MKNVVLENFRELSNIPRYSFDQKRINEYLINKAKEMGLEYDVDDELNIVIRKPATEDKKGHPGLFCKVTWTWSAKKKMTAIMISQKIR
ncbi:MAG: hypothetical protein ACLS8T_23900 [Anaerobutyricum sp.]